jgi:hypothetical protein
MKRVFLAAAVFTLGIPLFGRDYEDGRIRLALDPQLGRFSLYYLADPSQRKYEALFMDQDPRTSVVTVSYNGKNYRLGESAEFTISEGGTDQQPALIFESSFLRVTEEFSFIVTQGSQAANGVKVTFRIENTGRRRIQAGIRFLLDTKLGESGTSPFFTGSRKIAEEMIFNAKTGLDQYWVSGNTGELALMGSLSADVDHAPDMVHFANWKRLNEVSWSLNFVQGRKFNNPPYSIRDSAVAYYYEPVRISRGGSHSFYLLLGVQNDQGFGSFQASAGLPFMAQGNEPPASGLPEAGGTETQPPLFIGVMPDLNPAIIRSDYNALLDIVNRIDRYLESGARMSDDEISSMEQDLARIRSRYANPR